QTSLQRPPCSAHASLVTVVAEDNLIAGPKQFLDMLRCSRSPQRSYGIIQTVLRKADDIHIAFHDEDTAFAPDPGARLPQAIEFSAFREKGRFRRVQILGLALPDDAPAKAD